MTIDRILFTLFVLALAFLAFLAGAFAVLGKIFPYEFLHQAYLAGTALYVQHTEYGTPYETDLWRVARSDQRGVTRYDAKQAANGYTLYTSGDGPYARLIDMNGQVIHEWRRPFSTVWDESSPVDEPRPDEFIYMRKAHLLPNGELLAIYIASGDSPWGYGMVKLDRDSNVLWRYLDRTHHDLDIGPDGRIYTLTHDFSPRPVDFPNLANPYLQDFLVVLSPDGKPLKKISLATALANSPYAGLLRENPPFRADDPLHTNTVRRLEADEAAALPHAQEGDVLVSFRDLGAIAVLDVDREVIVWATRGPWHRQHDPSVLPNGHILLFDNLGGFRPDNATRILEIEPHTLGITWRYEGTPQQPLDSEIRGAAQRLNNGNTLITESDGGRLLEVTAAGEIVWEFVNPIRGGEGKRMIPVVSWGWRIPPAGLTADFKAALSQ